MTDDSIPASVVVQALADWTQALRDAEASKDWNRVGHVRRSMEQARVTLDSIVRPTRPPP